LLCRYLRFTERFLLPLHSGKNGNRGINCGYRW
jgi:hypothetical protein